MKVLVPKHVEGGLFDMGVDIGPFRVKMWQLFIIAVGVGIMFSMVKGLKESGLPTITSVIIASPVVIIAGFIAFFKKSELYIIPFIVKLLRTYVIGTPRTFQRNIIKPAEREIKLWFAKLNRGEEKNIEQKELKEEEINKNLDVLNKW